ncbi:hypothetical protein [Plantibacter sp. YIM 135249]|uniref:hypothetical protein n=1 Tax=Plantibacter sp. YIM 135249 TaxID=3423918 RepID=UPI003D345EED
MKFTTDDKKLLDAATRASIRTFAQVAEAQLALAMVAGGVLAITNLADLNWVLLLGTLGAIGLTSAYAALRSYLSIVAKGLPEAYVAAAKDEILAGQAELTPLEQFADTQAAVARVGRHAGDEEAQ